MIVGQGASRKPGGQHAGPGGQVSLQGPSKEADSERSEKQALGFCSLPRHFPASKK